MASTGKAPPKIVLRFNVPKKVLNAHDQMKVTKKVVSPRDQTKERYLSIKTIGEGSEGVVELCMLRTVVKLALRDKSAALSDTLKGSVRVVKYYKPDSRSDYDHLYEISVLRRIPENPYIQSLWEFDRKKKLWMTMPFYAGGSLRDFRKKLGKQVPESFVWHVVLQTLGGLHHLHSSGFAHGDIFDRNIMVDPAEREYKDYPNIVLCDFGRGIRESKSTPVNFKDAQTMDLINLGNEWHDLAHRSFPLGESDAEELDAEESDVEDTIARFSDGGCGCVDLGVDETPFGRDDDLFNRLMSSTSENVIDAAGTTIDTVRRDFYWDLLNRRERTYAKMPLIAELLFRNNMPKDREMEDALKRHVFEKKAATAATQGCKRKRASYESGETDDSSA